MSYLFDGTGNLSYRTDNLTNQREDFGYDGLNRLTNWTVTRGGVQTPYGLSYDPANLANIKTKSDLGNFTMNYGEGNGKPHALTTIMGVPTNFPTADLNVTYTDFKKIATLDEGTKHYELTYGVDDQRRMSVYKEGGVTKLTRYYVGDYEEEVNALGNVRKIHYLSGAILIQNNGVDSLLYTYSDFQGSLIALTKENGDTLQTYAYDPWGARRNPHNWNVRDSRTKWIINRGYTGHEHLDAFGIINMNGRVYDPATAQFFSPDPYVQTPGDWLNYNRYGYCMGNPFSYTDPSGYSWLSNNWRTILTTGAAIGVGIAVTCLTGGLGLAVAIQIGVLAGSAAGATSGVLGTALNGGSFGDCFMAGTKGGIFGGITGGVGGGLAMIGGAGMPFAENLLLGTGEGAVTGGLGAALSGDDIGEGMLMGAAAGAVFTTIFSENMSNALRGKDFKTNENVFKDFAAYKYPLNGQVWEQNALDYFGFRVTYDPSQSGPSYVEGNNSYGAYTNPKGEISYGDNVFTSYANLKGAYYKELYTSNKILNGGTIERQNVKGVEVYPEERLGFIEMYKNQGLYPNTSINIRSQIEYYQVQCMDLLPSAKFHFNWSDFIYKIPRRW